MSRNFKLLKMPLDLHERAVALDQRVVERFGPPPNYRRGGPGAAVHAGIALLEAVLNGEQEIVPSAHMRKCEAAYRARNQPAQMSTMMLAIAMGWARDQGAEDLDARASAIVAETIRTFVQLEVLEPEAEADPPDAENLRQMARTFLDDAERLAKRARAVMPNEVAQ